MNRRRRIHRLLGFSLTAALLAPSQAGAQGAAGGACTVSILNQTANVRPDGSWNVPNVPTNMGPVRARLTCLQNGATVAGTSGFFTVTANRMNAIPIVLPGAAAATPRRIRITAPVTALISPAQTVQASVTATFADGSTADVTFSSAGTVYASTDPRVAAVDAEGRVTAVRSGLVLISALNEAVVDAIAISVLLGGDDDGDGLPNDFELANGLDPGDPVDALEDLDGDGLINLSEFNRGTEVRNRDSDGDGIADGEEAVAGADGFVTSPLLADTDGDGVRDGLEILVGTHPADAASVDYAAVLRSFTASPDAFTLVKNTLLPEEVSRRLQVRGLLVDDSIVDLTARQTTYVSSNLGVANFGPEPGRVFAGADGTAVITATHGAFQATVRVNVVSFAPRALAFLRIPGFANAVAVDGDHAYVAAGAAGLQVVDIGDLGRPVILAAVDTPGNANDVRVVDGFAYVADGNRGLQVIDVQVPASPRIVGAADTPGIATDVAVAGDRAYVADGASGVRIFDVADPLAPVVLGGVDTPGNARGIDADGRFAVIADATGGVHVVDVADPAAPRLVGSTHTRPNAFSRAADVALRDGFAYVADGAASTLGGLRIIDLRTPGNPVVVGSSGDRFGLTSVALDRNLALAADYLFANAVPVFDVGVAPPAVLGSLDFRAVGGSRDDNGNGVAARDGVVFLAGSRGAIQDNGVSGDGGLHIGRYAVLGDDGGIAPRVAITSPAPGASFRERTRVTVRADASDDVFVAVVELLVDGVTVASDFSAPYSLDFSVPAGAGSVRLSAVARDLGGNETRAEDVALTVIPDSAPTVQLLAPAAGSRFTEGLSIDLAAAATDDVQVTSVRFFVDGSLLGTDTTAPYRIQFRVPGGADSFTVTATATDNVGQTATTQPLVVGIDRDQPPAVTVIEPLDGAEVIAASTLRVVVGATDDFQVAAVRFFVDGVLQNQVMTPPFETDVEVPVDSAQLRVAAEAVDSRGQVARSADAVLAVVPDPGTTVEGMVLLPDESPAAGATVSVFALAATTDASGRFSIAGVPTVGGLIVVKASLVDGGRSFAGSSAPAFPLPGEATDVGTIRLSAALFETDLGQNLFQGDDDSDFVPFTGGFRFPYFGSLQTGVSVNSNGNLTFGGGDTAFDPAVPTGVVAGRPRIAPLFTDLDPDLAPAGGGVFVNQFPDRFVVTWNRLPQFQEGGDNTFQAILFADGTIQLGYNGLTADGFGDGFGSDTLDLSVAVSPGGSPALRAVDYSHDTPLGTEGGQAVLESFSQNGSFDLDGGFLVFRPRAGGGFDVSFLPPPASAGRSVSAAGSALVAAPLSLSSM